LLILDTDLLSILLHGPPAERSRLTARLARVEGEVVAVTIVTFEEQMRGWMAVIARARTPEHMADAYRRLSEALESFARLRVLPFDLQAARHFGRLRVMLRRRGVADLKIAAVAIIYRGHLLTRNVRDFDGIEGLVVENPLRESSA
jgi:tRNA(fMet)-specific endonuclease VapC